MMPRWSSARKAIDLNCKPSTDYWRTSRRTSDINRVVPWHSDQNIEHASDYSKSLFLDWRQNSKRKIEWMCACSKSLNKSTMMKHYKGRQSWSNVKVKAQFIFSISMENICFKYLLDIIQRLLEKFTIREQSCGETIRLLTQPYQFASFVSEIRWQF